MATRPSSTIFCNSATLTRRMVSASTVVVPTGAAAPLLFFAAEPDKTAPLPALPAVSAALHAPSSSAAAAADARHAGVKNFLIITRLRKKIACLKKLAAHAFAPAAADSIAQKPRARPAPRPRRAATLPPRGRSVL